MFAVPHLSGVEAPSRSGRPWLHPVNTLRRVQIHTDVPSEEKENIRLLVVIFRSWLQGSVTLTPTLWVALIRRVSSP